MHVSLTPELEERVRAKVESGMYNNASEVIREALRFMELNESLLQELKLAALRKQIAIGIESLDAGAGVEISSKAALDEWMDSIKQ